MNGAQALVNMLIGYGVEVVFGLPGDTSVDFYDALRSESRRITHLMARDERSAAFMADVYARLSGRPGVCEGPSGGGATYLLPGIVEANGSSIAMIALTTDNPLTYEAQGALTALDQTRIYDSVTKWSALIKRSEMLPHFVRRAFRLATSGRPGAVHLGLPKDILAGKIGAGAITYIQEACQTWPSYRTRPAFDVVERAAVLLLQAKRPVVIAGGGAVSSGAHEELLRLARLLSAPVATTINGKGAIAETNLLSLGVIGANGGRPYAGQIVQEADLVLFVGTKANYVDTDQWRLPPLANPPVIVQIDVDPSEIGNNYPVDEGMCGDAKCALSDLVEVLRERRQMPVERVGWLNDIVAKKRSWRKQLECPNTYSDSLLLPRQIIQELGARLPEDTIYVCDPGTPTPYMAAEFELCQPGRRVITPRAQGGLGYAIPGVVGARMARPESPIVGLCGDGSVAMAAGDMATVARIGGPIILLLFRNSSYGWIKALQKLHHSSRFFSVDFTEPLDYLNVAEGFGLRGTQVNDMQELRLALKDALSYGGPYFIDVDTVGEDEVIPPVAPWLRRTAQ